MALGATEISSVKPDLPILPPNCNVFQNINCVSIILLCKTLYTKKWKATSKLLYHPKCDQEIKVSGFNNIQCKSILK
jgi:hypothetical protein